MRRRFNVSLFSGPLSDTDEANGVANHATYHSCRSTHSGVCLAGKFTFGTVTALVGRVLFSPFLVLCPFGICMMSSRPVFSWQAHAGYMGRELSVKSCRAMKRGTRSRQMTTSRISTYRMDRIAFKFGELLRSPPRSRLKNSAPVSWRRFSRQGQDTGILTIHPAELTFIEGETVFRQTRPTRWTNHCYESKLFRIPSNIHLTQPPWRVVNAR